MPRFIRLSVNRATYRDVFLSLFFSCSCCEKYEASFRGDGRVDSSRLVWETCKISYVPFCSNFDESNDSNEVTLSSMSNENATKTVFLFDFRRIFFIYTWKFFKNIACFNLKYFFLNCYVLLKLSST